MKKMKVKDKNIIQKRSRLRNSSLKGQIMKKNKVKSFRADPPKNRASSGMERF